MTRDTWDGNANKPMSFNRWGYVEGNPVNYADPTGLCEDINGDGVCDPEYSTTKIELMGEYYASTDSPSEDEEAYEDISNASQKNFTPSNNPMDWIQALTDTCNKILLAFNPPPPPKDNVFVYLRYEEFSNGTLDQFQIKIDNRSNIKLHLAFVEYHITSYCEICEPTLAYVLPISEPYLMTNNPHEIKSVFLSKYMTSVGGPPFRWCKEIKVATKVYGRSFFGKWDWVTPSLSIKQRFYGIYEEYKKR